MDPCLPSFCGQRCCGQFWLFFLLSSTKGSSSLCPTLVQTFVIFENNQKAIWWPSYFFYSDKLYSFQCPKLYLHDTWAANVSYISSVPSLQFLPFSPQWRILTELYSPNVTSLLTPVSYKRNSNSLQLNYNFIGKKTPCPDDFCYNTNYRSNPA